MAGAFERYTRRGAGVGLPAGQEQACLLNKALRNADCTQSAGRRTHDLDGDRDKGGRYATLRGLCKGLNGKQRARPYDANAGTAGILRTARLDHRGGIRRHRHIRSSGPAARTGSPEERMLAQIRPQAPVQSPLSGEAERDFLENATTDEMKAYFERKYPG